MKKMKKMINVIFLIVILALSFSACTSSQDANDPIINDQVLGDESEESQDKVDEETFKIEREINVAVPSGTPALSIIKMINENYQPEGYKVNYEVINSTDLLSAKILSNEADILIVPTNLAAKFYNKGVDYKLKSVNVWGSLYIVADANEEITSLNDLEGREIYTIGEGLTPDIITKYILKENNIENVKFNYLAGATELAPMFLSGKSKISLMPEPILSLVKTKKEDTQVLVDLQSEWARLSDNSSSYPQSGLYINNEVLEDKVFSDLFLEEVEKSIVWLNENPSEAALYYESLGLSPPAKIIEKSIAGSNLKFAKTSEIRETMNKYFEVLYKANPDSIGGMIPSEELYE